MFSELVKELFTLKRYIAYTAILEYKMAANIHQYEAQIINSPEHDLNDLYGLKAM